MESELAMLQQLRAVNLIPSASEPQHCGHHHPDHRDPRDRYLGSSSVLIHWSLVSIQLSNEIRNGSDQISCKEYSKQYDG
jgi:hypothetical protein